MAIQHRLADRLLTGHPVDAARSLEQLSDDDAAAILRRQPARVAAAILARVAAHRGAAILGRLQPEATGRILGELNPNVAAALLRRESSAEREHALAATPSQRAASIRRLLRYRENTAGALMDPSVLTLPQELSAKQAIAYVRDAPDQARDNLYVVDGELVLVGVLTFRELFLARAQDPLTAFMTTPVHSLPAQADRHAIVRHPAWQAVHALPVVDRQGVFLGVISYRALRRLELELIGGEPVPGASTAEALGDLFGAGVAGFIGAIAPKRTDHGS